LRKRRWLGVREQKNRSTFGRRAIRNFKSAEKKIRRKVVISYSTAFLTGPLESGAITQVGENFSQGREKGLIEIRR